MRIRPNNRRLKKNRIQRIKGLTGYYKTEQASHNIRPRGEAPILFTLVKLW